MKPNRVTLFSNGMGHFIRHYDVKSNEPKKISLPFNKNHIGDVATSLNTFRSEGGLVRYSVPPSFTPTNSTTSTVKIDAKNALRSLLETLSGSEVKIGFVNSSKTEENFRIIGIDSIDSLGLHGEVIKQDAVSVLDSNNTIHRFRLSEINGIKFTNESVQVEVDKALRANFQSIKPESTFIDLVLESDQDSIAAVTYTIPVAAWKMRYSIQQEGDKFFLEGAVVVDNNTDEDWDNFVVSVVTGDPISFMTDIAEIKTPQRHTVNLVNTEAVGNVNVESGYALAGLECCAGPMAASAKSSRNIRSKMQYAQESNENTRSYIEDMVISDGVDTKEVGDFCIFTSKTPISIASKKSAVVPMFTVALETASVVLLYKESNHENRPFRAVKFKNETTHTLGKGKVVLYNDGLLSGECVLETAKPGENRMLPHCLENSIRVIRDNQKNVKTLSAIKLSNSIAVQQWVNSSVNNYVIENNKNEEFQIAFEVPATLGMDATFNYSGVDVREIEKLQNGYRLYFTIAPNQKLTLNIDEKLVLSQSINIDNNFNWIKNNIISTGNELLNNEGIKRCIEIQEEIDTLDTKLNKLNEKSSKLDTQADRIRRNIESTKSTNTGLTEWISDLDRLEKECRKIEDIDSPKLEDLKDIKQKQLQEALKQISASWSNDTIGVLEG